MTISTINIRREKNNSCLNCITRKFCVSCELSHLELDEFEELSRHRRTLHKGERLFRQGDKFQSLSIIQSGSVKAYVISDDGEQQISGFHFPGELLGLDGVESGWQTYGAEALETSSICDLSFRQFDQLTEQFDSLRQEFYKNLGKQLAGAKRRMLILGRQHAEQRIASFILDIAARTGRRDDGRVMFTMTRHDIANYLGLAVETVSRILTRFDLIGVVKTQHRSLQIQQLDKLFAIAAGITAQSIEKKTRDTASGELRGGLIRSRTIRSNVV